MRILIVDDSATIRRILKNIIRMMKITKEEDVFEASDGEEAVELYNTNHAFDLVLLDKSMPKMDGLLCLSRIRQVDNEVPIIMITCESEKSKVYEAIKAGVSEYIVKPFKIDTVIDKINGIIDKYNLMPPEEEGKDDKEKS